jgi:hypothetical protein
MNSDPVKSLIDMKTRQSLKLISRFNLSSIVVELRVFSPPDYVNVGGSYSGVVLSISTTFNINPSNQGI